MQSIADGRKIGYYLGRKADGGFITPSVFFKERRNIKMEKIGLQLYTVREYLNSHREIRILFEQLKNMGYTEIEPFGAIENMEAPSRAAREAGLDISGTISHLEAYEDRRKTVEFCRKFGIENLGLSADEFKSADEVKLFIGKTNTLADYLGKYGIKISYHNHSHEFRKYENGKTAYEMMIEGFDRNKIGFVLDTYWIQHGGGDIRHLTERLNGRLTALHMKDMKRIEKNAVTYAAVGEGNLWWDGIIAAAEEAGAKHFVVEQDECDRDSIECIRDSAAFLKRYLNK